MEPCEQVCLFFFDQYLKNSGHSYSSKENFSFFLIILIKKRPCYLIVSLSFFELFRDPNMGDDSYDNELLSKAKVKPNGLPYYVRRKTGFASLKTRFFRLFYLPQNELFSSRFLIEKI